MPGADGIAIAGNLQLGVGYATTTGMTMAIEITGLPRLVVLPK